MFSVHPVHVEALSIVSRSDLLACFVFLLSGILYFHVFNKGEFGLKSCLHVSSDPIFQTQTPSDLIESS